MIAWFKVSLVLLPVAMLAIACGGSNTVSTSGNTDAPAVLGQSVAVPDGVEPDLIAVLAAELERQLIAQGGKGIADVTGVYVDPLDVTAVADDARLEWVYNNKGDYNLDGFVTVSDLTPIGIHFDKNTGSPDWAAASCADGTNDGFITVADITPIGQNFDSGVTNYVVEADVEGDETWVPVANIPQSNGGPGPDTDWLHYSELITNGAYAQAFRVYAGPEASPLVPIEIDPTVFWVNLSAAPTGGTEPLHVTFDVHIDNGSPPYAIHIDYGDADIDDLIAPSIGHYSFEHTYVAGEWTASVAVTDNDADEKTDEIDISVEAWGGGNPLMNPGFWVTYEMKDGEDYGKHSAIAVVDGRPMMIYTDDDRREIEFAMATVEKPESLSDWTQYTLDDGDNRGGTLDIAEVQGVPCVVYEDTMDQDIWFGAAHHAWPADIDWWIHEPDWAGFSEPQLAALDDGTEEDPILVYRTAGAVRFARSLVDGALPTEGGTEPPDGEWQVLDVATGVQYEFPRIAVFGGFPAIAYQEKDFGDAQLMYGRATSVTPDTLGDWVIYSVDDDETNSGLGIVLAAVDGLPAIGYRSININDYLKYAWADTALPTGSGDWNTIMVRDKNMTNVGRWLGMVGYDKLPIFSYVNTGPGSEDGLQVSYPTSDPPVNHAFDSAILDPGEGYFVNEQTNMILLSDGTPAILYRTSEGLKFAYFQEVAL